MLIKTLLPSLPTDSFLANLAMQFGLVGGFEHDAPKLEQARALASKLQDSATSASVTVSDVVNVLEVLPHAGRLEFVGRVLVKSPARDSLLRGVFDWCFEVGAAGSEEIDADFVMVGSGGKQTLDSAKSYVLRAVVAVLSGCGRLGIELFEKYEGTSSTTFRVPLLVRLAAVPEFPDDALEAAYLATVESGRNAIVRACCRVPHRQRFLERLVNNSQAPDAAVFWAGSGAVRAWLLGDDPARATRIRGLGFRNWRAHSEVYLKYLAQQFRAAEHDPLGRGEALRKFEGCAGHLESEHATALLTKCLSARPVEIRPAAGVNGKMQAYLRDLSQNGELEGEFECLRLALPHKKSLAGLRDVSAVVGRYVDADSGTRFAEEHEALCAELLAKRGSRRSRGDRARVAQLAVRCFDNLPAPDFWALLLLRSDSAAMPPAARAASAFESAFNAVARRGQHHVTRLFIDAWLDLHRRCVPSAATAAAGGARVPPLQVGRAIPRAPSPPFVPLAVPRPPSCRPVTHRSAVTASHSLPLSRQLASRLSPAVCSPFLASPLPPPPAPPHEGRTDMN